jgi:hypothetical protein
VVDARFSLRKAGDMQPAVGITAALPLNRPTTCTTTTQCTPNSPVPADQPCSTVIVPLALAAETCVFVRVWSCMCSGGMRLLGRRRRQGRQGMHQCFRCVAKPQTANLQHQVEIGRFGRAPRVEIAISTRKMSNRHFHTKFAKYCLDGLRE